MDGLSKSDEHVFLLAASNLPWELDTAMLRRLEKRVNRKLIQILIDLPDMNAREALFETLLTTSGDFSIETVNHAGLAAVTEGARLVDEGYSGADINLVCREAAMRPLRILFEKLDSGLVSDGM